MALPVAGGVFLNIPSPIITDILARLPPDAVVRCRCVCKAWLKLLSEAEFVNLHLSKSPTRLIVHKLSSSPPDSASFSLVEVEDETDHHGVRYMAGMDREIPRSRQNIGITMIGSINGLVCVDHFAVRYDDIISIWNPVIGEFITVQTPQGKQEYPNVTTFGFGISSGKYQVVRIFQEIEITDSSETKRIQIHQSTCHIYTIGTGFWRSIGHAPYHYNPREHGLFLNGNLHWLIHDDKDDPELMCCLDLERESFQPFPPPPELCQSHLATLNLYKGCMSVCDNTSDFDIVIWVMKEYGVQNSWTKEVVISKHLIDLVGNYYEVVRIIKVFKDGEILFLWRDDYLYSYHPKRKTVQNMDVEESMAGPRLIKDYFGCPPCIEATEYVSSFVSLKNLGEVNVNRASILIGLDTYMNSCNS